MKRNLLFISLSVAMATQAQKNSAIYEVTDPVKGGFNWTAIRDVAKGAEGAFVMDNKTAAGAIIDARLQQKKGDFSPTSANYKEQPLFSGVAALAFDKEHNRLYYSTMFTQQLRYITLGKNQSTQYFQAAAIPEVIKTRGTSYTISQNEQGPVITRMTIGADGYGYGLSNDGQSFFRFSLDKKTDVQELGALVDDTKNGAISVHNQCSSWGGDMVAAANGDLYLFTMRQNIFRIDPATRVATYLGKLQGIDDKFTVNGAAVDDDGKVLLSTAAYTGSRALVEDLESFKTTELKGLEYGNASDLASANLLFANKVTKAFVAEKLIADKNISVYPNPVRNGFALLQFDKLSSGKFTIDVLNGAGGNVQRKSVTLNSEGQQVRLNTSNLAKGLYVVKVTDASRKEVYTTKLIIQ